MSKWFRSTLLLGFCCALLLPLSACQLKYLVKSAYSQADILRRRTPIEEVLKDPTVPDETKRKLRLAQRAHDFAETNLSLKKSLNYTSFVQLDRTYVSYVVSAAPKDELKHHLWKFPIVGEMPYKGFFDPEGAKEEGERLKQEGFDVYIRGVGAYSTLGWFRDPILSSMLVYNDFDLVNTIIHETTHATVFIRSEADFNERLASFVGNKGTEKFYAAVEGQDSKTLKAIAEENADERIFSEFISREIETLEKWYNDRKGHAIPEEIRQTRFQEIQTRFTAEVRPRLKVLSYKDFEKTPLNNAHLLLYKLYQKDMSDFETLFDNLDHDFSKLVTFCKVLEKQNDPEHYLKDSIKKPLAN